MGKPYLFIVTGRPGAGKTTFAKAFAQAAFLPVLSRDELKEGYVHTQGRPHQELPPEVNRIVTDLFFDTIGSLVDHGVSLVAEAALQHPVWSARLEPLLDRAQVHVMLCSPGGDGRAALDRFLQRGLGDPRREYFHGDKGVAMARQGMELAVSAYEEPRLNVPTWRIDTLDGCQPDASQLIKAVWGENKGPF